MGGRRLLLFPVLWRNPEKWATCWPKPRTGISISENLMARQGSGGNVLAALCSFFIPGFGQLLQGRVLPALIYFVLSLLLWFVFLGWVIHLIATIEAATFEPPPEPVRARR
jgi:hypothetical protein